MSKNCIFKLLQFFCLISPLFGLLKLQPDDKMLIEDADEDVVYLFTFPRTSLTISQAPLNLKMEAWLKWNGVKFMRVSEHFFLGSQTTGTCPFVQYNGEYIDGSDAIIEKIGAVERQRKDKLGVKVLENGSPEIQKFADDVMFKLLMRDHITRNAQGKGGLDFMLKDAGVRQQMMPVLPVFMFKPQTFTISGTQFTMDVSGPAFWGAYFEALDEKNVPKRQQLRADFVKAHFGGKKPWEEVMDVIENFITENLKTVLTKKDGSSEAKLHQLLELNTWDGKKYSEYSDDELFDKFLKTIEELKIVEMLENKEGPFLHGMLPTTADASLFGILVQFFDMPLNMEKFRNFFAPPNGEFEHAARVLRNFVEHGKLSLDFTQNWRLLTQKPWPLNYELNAHPEGKYNGPFISRMNTGSLLLKVNFTTILQWLLHVRKPPKDTLAGLLELNAMEKFVFQQILQNIERMTVGEQKVYAKPMIVETMAYLCNLGPHKTPQAGLNCLKQHLAKLNHDELRRHKEILRETRSLVFNAVVEFFAGEKIAAATKKAAMVAQNPDKMVAQGASSTAKQGNEF